MQDVPSCQRGTSAQFCNRNGLWQPLAFALELDSELHPPKKRRTLAYKCAQRYQLYTQPQPTSFACLASRLASRELYGL